MKMTFGQRLKELRKAKNLTQRDLAEKVAKALRDREEGRGFDFTYLSKIENDKLPPPSRVVIIQLSKDLDADSHELLGLAEKVHPETEEALKKSEYARVFFRSAVDLNLNEKDWKDLIEEIKRRKNISNENV